MLVEYKIERKMDSRGWEPLGSRSDLEEAKSFIQASPSLGYRYRISKVTVEVVHEETH